MRTIIGQLWKFAIAGVATSAAYSLLYLLFADYILAPGLAVVAVIPAFLLSLGLSFLLHSRWSFAGHGTREKGMAQTVRFTVVQMGGLALNTLFTYLVTSVLGGANWQALIPCLTITPLVAFAAQRMWVFSDRRPAAPADPASSQAADAIY